ncbi:MAG: lysoplasmalogenase [Christensenellaceae bacterium]|jgi:uncharacterized membrane protein YhhN|nr:lysoplasmalogenase [Christensenellaceae bacterium]
MVNLYITSGLCMFLGMLASFFNSLNKQILRIIVKTVASIMFCVTALIAVVIAKEYSMYAIGVLVALLLGLVGDIFLCIDCLTEDKGKLAIQGFGVLLFLAGHIFYIAIFMNAAPFQLWALSIVFAFPVILGVVIATGLLKIKRAMILPCIIYSILLGLTVASAISLYFTQRNTAHLLVAIASVLFAISDTFLIVRESENMTTKNVNRLMYIVLFTYYAAQCMFAITIAIQ